MKTFLTITELESVIDSNGGKSVFDLKGSPKRNLTLEARILDTYPTATAKGKALRTRYIYDKTPADTAAYAAYVEYMETYFTALGYEGIEEIAATYWTVNKPLSTQTVN